MGYLKAKARLIKEERRALERRVAAARATAEGVLNDMGRRLFYLSREDSVRLLNLQYWAEREKVEFVWVLKTLVEHYAQRFSRNKKSKNGFGTRMTTLAGRNAEEVLKEKLKELFPDEEQLYLWAQSRRWEIIDERKARAAGYSGDEDDGTIVRKKSLLDFDFPKQYVRWYAKQVKFARQEMDRELTRKANRQFSYRDNPWL